MNDVPRRWLPPQGNPYYVDPTTNQIKKLYMVGLTLEDGTEKWFVSEEHADAFLEGRKANWKPGMA